MFYGAEIVFLLHEDALYNSQPIIHSFSNIPISFSTSLPSNNSLNSDPSPPSSFETLTIPSHINTPSPKTASYPAFCNRCFNSSNLTSPTCSGLAGGIEIVLFDNKDKVGSGRINAVDEVRVPFVSTGGSWGVIDPIIWAICWFCT